MCVFSLRRRRHTRFFSLIHQHSNKKCVFIQVNDSSCLLVLMLPPLAGYAHWLMSHDSDSAVAFTYSTRSPLWLFGFHSDVQCHRAEIWFRLVGVGQVSWGWHRARRPWKTGDLGFVTSFASSGHHGINFPYCLMNEGREASICSHWWCSGEFGSPSTKRRKPC